MVVRHFVGGAVAHVDTCTITINNNGVVGEFVSKFDAYFFIDGVLCAKANSDCKRASFIGSAA